METNLEKDLLKVVLEKPMSPDAMTVAERGSVERVKASGPEMWKTVLGSSDDGRGHEITLRWECPAGLANTMRKADGAMEVGLGAENGDQVIDEGWVESGAMAERMSSFCLASRLPSRTNLVAPNICLLRDSCAAAPAGDSSAAWIARREEGRGMMRQ